MAAIVRLAGRHRAAVLLLAALIFLAADTADQSAGTSFLHAGPLDETAHLLTTGFIVWALWGRADRFMVPALIASVTIDLDHLPRDFGSTWLTAGTPRPYPHSLLTIGCVLLLAVAWRRRRTVLLGVALGLVTHFWRDLAEPGPGVALLWPLSDESFSLGHAWYLAGMGAVIAIGAIRLRYGPPLSLPAGRLRTSVERPPDPARGRWSAARHGASAARSART